MFEILSLPSQHKSINKQFKTLRIMIKFENEITNAYKQSKEYKQKEKMFSLRDKILSLNDRIIDLIDTANHLIKHRFLIVSGPYHRKLKEGDETRTIVAIANGWGEKLGFISCKSLIGDDANETIKYIGVENGSTENPQNLMISQKGVFYGPFGTERDIFDYSYLEEVIKDMEYFLNNFDKFEKNFYEKIKELCCKN